MSVDPRAPVIIGAGQFLHRADGVEDGLEPIDLMAEATRAAATDAGLGGPPGEVDSIRVINSLSWRYRNAAWVLAERLQAQSGELAYTTGGGQTPQALVNRTALDIAEGRADLVLLTGGEAWRTRLRARRDDVFLDWAKAPDEFQPVVLGDELDMNHPAEVERGLALPAQMYALFEPALRAETKTPVEEHRRTIAELWSRFSAVAESNPHAWSRRAMTADEIATATPDNRMICSPYTKVMNANNDVDMAAALIMCSASKADALGVSRDRWVFPVAGTDCNEHQYASNRWSFADTPAIRIGGQRVLGLAGVGIDEIAFIDLYSCFPSAVRLGAASLGLDLGAQLTRTGGLSFAGAPWNSYSLHAIATIAGELREGPGERALVWANGGFVTKHAFGVYAIEPPNDGYRHDRPQAAIDALPRRDVAGGDEAAGEATLEAYTVAFDRAGAPQQAFAACLLPDGRRAWAASDDDAVMAALTDDDWVGHPVTTEAGGGLRL